MNNEIKKTKKLNNKGFSLVELIIVIAIMAVLIGILAPQYLQYVEKSRRSADATTVDQFVSAMQILASDPSVSLDSSKTYTVTSTTAGDITISDDLKALFTTAGTIDTTKTYTYKSSSFKAQATTITLGYDSTNKVWKVTQSNVPTV